MLKNQLLCDGHFVLFRFSKNSLSHLNCTHGRRICSCPLSTCLSTCKLANEMCGCLESKDNLYFTKAFLNYACDSMKQDTCVFVDYLLPISVTYICIYEMSI